MQGTDSTTGASLSGEAHLRQSLADILRTPIGSRVGNRAYGSRLFELIDAPMNAATIAAIYAAVAEAVVKWEPRLKLKRTVIEKADPGRISLSLEGEYLERSVTIRGITV